ncbi:hypothetical protein GCM10027299_03830 [Larkinella ripae]
MGLVSCEKSADMIRPDEGQSSANNTPRPIETTPKPGIPTTGPGGVIVVTPKYTLVKYAHWNLSYDAKGDLVQMQSTADPTLFRDYSRASNGTGMTILEQSGGKMTRKTLILFDTKGRCKQSFNITYGIENGQVTSSTKRYDYFYNAKNQLEKIADQDNSKRYDLFQYNPDGNLRQVKHYNTNVTQRTTYYYDYPGQAAIVDKNHLSPLWMPHYDQVDEFLPIYGKFNKHLVWKLEYDDAVSNVNLDQVYFKYKMNNDGFITERENTRNTASQTLKETYVFGYK